MEYIINDNGWYSKKEYDDYKKWLKPKLKALFNKGYYPYWDEESNWIKITKKIRKKNDNRMIMILSAKVFSEPSTYGINDGGVSKLTIMERGDYPNPRIAVKQYYNYDRGHDLNNLRNSVVAKKMFDDLLEVIDGGKK